MTARKTTSKTVAPRKTASTEVDHRREERQRQRDAATEYNLTPAEVTPFTSDIQMPAIRPVEGLSDKDQQKVIKITRAYARVGKGKIAAKKAELLADVEKKLSEEFEHDNEMWAEVNKIAHDAVCAANDQIAAKAAEIGIPKEFVPYNALVWVPRGSNLNPRRRAELRKLAEARIKVLERDAVAQLEARVAIIEADVLASGLGDQAREYLISLDDPTGLLGSIEVSDLKEDYYAEHPWARPDD